MLPAPLRAVPSSAPPITSSSSGQVRAVRPILSSCLTEKTILNKIQRFGVGFLFRKTHYFYRMKRMSFRCLTLVSVSIVLQLSCNKTHYTPALANALFQSDVQAQAEDQIRIPSEIDALFNDINTVLLYKDTVINDTETITSHFPTICGLYAVTKN